MAVSVAVELIGGNEEENGESEHRCEENGNLSDVNKNHENEKGKLDDHIKENGNLSQENVYFKENGELSEENKRNNHHPLSCQNEENSGELYKENVNPYKENGIKSDDGQLCNIFINFFLSFMLVVQYVKVSKIWSERQPQQLGQLLPLSPVQRQCVVGVLVAGVGCSLGVVLAYPALALDTWLLQKEGEVHGITLSHHEAQWIRSVVYLSSIPGSAVGGVLVQALGPRRLLLVLIPALTLTWLLLLLATPYPPLLVTLRALQGVLVSSCSLAVYVYPCEVVEAGRRGLVGALPEAFFSLGFLLSHLLTSLLRWPTVILLVSVCLFFPAFLVLSTAPESPIWLINKGKVPEAIQALRLIRPPGADVEKEVLGIQTSQVPPSGYEAKRLQEVMLSVPVSQQATSERKEKVVNVHMPRELSISTAGVRKQSWRWCVFLLPLLVSLVLVLLKESTGQIVVVLTSVSIFREAGMGLSPLWTSVLVSFARFVANLAASFLLIHLPRRHILVVMSMLACAAMLSLAGFFHASEQGHPWPGWVPFMLLMTFVVAYGGGIGPVVSLFVTELLPGAVRGIGSGLSNALLCSVQFSLTYVTSMQDLRYDLCFAGYAAGCFLLACFALILPETKDRKLEDVEQFWQDISLSTSCLGWCSGVKTKNTRIPKTKRTRTSQETSDDDNNNLVGNDGTLSLYV